MSEYRRDSLTVLTLRYFAKHPALAISVAYAMLTVCGVVYSAKFFSEFDVPILKLANVSDLLASGISEPAAILMFCGGLLVGIAADFFTQYSSKVQTKWREKPKGIKRTLFMFFFYVPKTREREVMYTLPVFLAYAYIFVAWYASWHSDRIKQGVGDKVVISSSIFKEKPSTQILLGSTTRFIFTYDNETKKATAIPIERLNNFHAAILPNSTAANEKKSK